MSRRPDVQRSSSKVISRGRKLSTDNVDTTTTTSNVTTKPRRPYTPYNLFYLLERELIVQEKEPAMRLEKEEKRAQMLADPKRHKVIRAEDDIELPTRYKGCILLPHWYEPNLKEKRKHRKTQGKISFKELTGIISQNWSTIDKETKDYCTQISEMGRKRYKEVMIRYNASQKVIQLKKEHAEMQSAKNNRFGQQSKSTKSAKLCRSPTQTVHFAKAKKSNPVTPERNLSHHGAAPIVTPSRSAYNSNQFPMHVPSGPQFYGQYGPPPPLPPVMPVSQSMPGQQQIPRSMMQMYRQHHQLQQQRQYPTFNYPKPPPLPKVKSKSKKTSSKNNKFFSNMPTPIGGGHNINTNVNTSDKTNVNVSINVCVTKDDSSNDGTAESNKSGMSHEEAMRLCQMMDSPGKRNSIHSQYEAPLNDQHALLKDMPSFDFADHHSLSSESGENMSQQFDVQDLLDQADASEDNMMNFILGEETFQDGSFPDIKFAL